MPCNIPAVGIHLLESWAGCLRGAQPRHGTGRPGMFIENNMANICTDNAVYAQVRRGACLNEKPTSVNWSQSWRLSGFFKAPLSATVPAGSCLLYRVYNTPLQINGNNKQQSPLFSNFPFHKSKDTLHQVASISPYKCNLNKMPRQIDQWPTPAKVQPVKVVVASPSR